MFVLGYDVYVRRAGRSNILLLKKNYGYSEKETTETFAQARLIQCMACARRSTALMWQICNHAP